MANYEEKKRRRQQSADRVYASQEQRLKDLKERNRKAAQKAADKRRGYSLPSD